jgi:hypothetical protein
MENQAKNSWQYYAEIKKILDSREQEAKSPCTDAKLWDLVLPYLKFCLRSGYINNDNAYALLKDKKLAEAWIKRGM